MIINIPIEPLPMRYSVDWNRWFIDYFKNNEIEYINVPGQELTKGIEEGRFLDCVGTNYYKSSQLMSILKNIYKGIIGDGDVLFFHDLWFPGIEQIKYTCDAMGKRIKIMGCLHAGAYDPNDMLYQKGMGNWAIHFEHMLFALVDKVFVATEFHKKLIVKSRSLDQNKIKVTGFPFIPRKSKIRGKRNQILFPHRHDSEKNPGVFYELAGQCKHRLPGWSFLTTKETMISNNKEAYYKMLEESSIVISVSDQETWGIAMQEAVIAGCIPLVPNKLSYVEMFFNAFKYNNYLELPSLLEGIIGDYDNFQVLRMDQAVRFEHLGMVAFENILHALSTN